MKLDFGVVFENDLYYEINGYTVASTTEDLADFTAWYFKEDLHVMKEKEFSEDKSGYLDDWE